jgi:ribosomal protein S6--L-glutamate ligase
MSRKKYAIALEARLKKCTNVRTLGVRSNFSDYSPEEAELINRAEKIYYPTTFYADLFDAMGKKTFPSYHTYKFAQDKIKQTALFQMLKIPHPRTRVFYGKRQKGQILEYFDFPFIGKIPRGSAQGRGVFLIRNRAELDTFCALPDPAYIQEFFKFDRDVRAVVIGDKVVLAYWRVAATGEFRCNISAGARVCLDIIPKEILDLALFTAKACGWNDVGIDICEYKGRYYVLEANVKYGKEGFLKFGIDYYQLMEDLIDNGEI